MKPGFYLVAGVFRVITKYSKYPNDQVETSVTNDSKYPATPATATTWVAEIEKILSQRQKKFYLSDPNDPSEMHYHLSKTSAL